MYDSRADFADLILNSEIPVLVDFYADWCGPCQVILPELEAFCEKLAGKMQFVRVDIERHPQVSLKYTIHHIPTLVLFHRGQILWRKNGAIPIRILEQEVLPHVA